MARKEAIIDLYIHLALGGMTYVNTDKLVEYKEDARFNSIDTNP